MLLLLQTPPQTTGPTVGRANTELPTVTLPRLIQPHEAIWRGQILRQSWQVKNSSTATWEFVQLDRSCGCTKASCEPATVPPGGVATISLELTTGSSPLGPQRWQGQVVWQSRPLPGHPEASRILQPFEVRSEVKPYLEVNPAQVALSTSHTATLPIQVTRQDQQPIRVLAVRTSHPALQVQVSPKVPGESLALWNASVTLLESYPPGLRDETVDLTIDDPRVPELRIPVRIQKRPPEQVVIYPESIQFRWDPTGTTQSQVLQIRRPDGEPVQLDQIHCPEAAVEVRYQPGVQGRVVHARVFMDAPQRSGETELRLRVNGKLLIVPVRWTVAEQAKP